MKTAWLAPASSGTPAPRVNGSATDATWWNYIGDDIRAWGGNVSAEGHDLVNLGQLVFAAGGGITQDAWTAITPLNSWANVGPNLAARLAKEGVIRIYGRIDGGATPTIANDTVVGTLPVAMRPSAQTTLEPVTALTAGGVIVTGSVYVATDGSIKLWGIGAGARYLHINLSFPVA